jgi:STE24 endopeptidase|mmetsp:Transcript_29700/g.5350  ORF Transcript_29700/g.5350 Transcript_29700/m.5350 type:complete len:146 (-) Transcript_29700:322-759(-)
MESTGEMFYLYVWAFISVFLIIFMALYHNLIAPLFNTFTPLEEGKLKQRIEEIADGIKFPLKQIYVIDGSKRSDHSNAYFFGFLNNKRIVIYDTLLDDEKQMSVEEISSIVAHELGHWYHSHFVKRLIILEVYIFVLFYLFTYVV